MGYVPGRKSDLFLSYAHAEQEWCDHIRKELGRRLHWKLGAEVAIWQDRQQITASDDWNSKILDAAREAAVFAAICSPSYFESEFCDEERKAFIGTDLEKLKVASHYRLLKVFKAPRPDGSHERFLPKIEPLRFFPQGANKHDGYPFTSDEFSQGLRDATSILHEILRAMRNDCETVYVARSTQDIHRDRRDLIDQLKGYSFNVVSLGPDFDDEYLRATIEPATFCVFPVGSEYDDYFQRQLEAARYLKKRILFWIAPVRQSQAKGRQADFIRQAIADASMEWRGSVTVSEFVRELQLWLNPAPAAAPVAKQIYLMHDRTQAAESEVAHQLRALIEASHRRVLPQAGIYPPDELAERPKLLRESDGVLIYRGQTRFEDDLWLQDALGRARVAKAPKALITGTPPAPDLLPGFHVLRYDPPPTVSLLKPFFDLMDQARSAHAGR